MTREQDGERTQRTVAELLAQHGNKAESTGTRRRRRRQDDAEPNADPQTIIRRVRLGEPTPDSTPQAAQTDPHLPIARPPAPPPQAAAPPLPVPPPPAAPSRTETSRRNLPYPPGPVPSGPPPTGYFPPPPAQPLPSGPPDIDPNADTTPQPIVQQPPGVVGSQPPEPQTQEFARISNDVLPGNVLPSESTQAHPGPLVDDDYLEDDYPSNGHPGDDFLPQEHTQAHLEPFVDDDYDDEFPEGEAQNPLGLEDESHQDQDESAAQEQTTSPARQWLMMAVQLGIGLIAGAAVWLGFQWGWQQLPAAALVAAILATVGLVLVVRKIRGAEDLQTMLLAVLVGLIVTVSPVAFLLIRN